MMTTRSTYAAAAAVENLCSSETGYKGGSYSRAPGKSLRKAPAVVLHSPETGYKGGMPSRAPGKSPHTASPKVGNLRSSGTGYYKGGSYARTPGKSPHTAPAVTQRDRNKRSLAAGYRRGSVPKHFRGGAGLLKFLSVLMLMIHAADAAADTAVIKETFRLMIRKYDVEKEGPRAGVESRFAGWKMYDEAEVTAQVAGSGIYLSCDKYRMFSNVLIKRIEYSGRGRFQGRDDYKMLISFNHHYVLDRRMRLNVLDATKFLEFVKKHNGVTNSDGVTETPLFHNEKQWPAFVLEGLQKDFTLRMKEPHNWHYLTHTVRHLGGTSFQFAGNYNTGFKFHVEKIEKPHGWDTPQKSDYQYRRVLLHMVRAGYNRYVTKAAPRYVLLDVEGYRFLQTVLAQRNYLVKSPHIHDIFPADWDKQHEVEVRRYGGGIESLNFALQVYKASGTTAKPRTLPVKLGDLTSWMKLNVDYRQDLLADTRVTLSDGRKLLHGVGYSAVVVPDEEGSDMTNPMQERRRRLASSNAFPPFQRLAKKLYEM